MSDLVIVQTVNALRTDVYEGRKLLVTTINYWPVDLVESLIRLGLDLTEAATISSNCCTSCTSKLRALCSLEPKTDSIDIENCEFCSRVNEIVEERNI